jgi:hypothetical protein
MNTFVLLTKASILVEETGDGGEEGPIDSEVVKIANHALGKINSKESCKIFCLLACFSNLLLDMNFQLISYFIRLIYYTKIFRWETGRNFLQKKLPRLLQTDGSANGSTGE